MQTAILELLLLLLMDENRLKSRIFTTKYTQELDKPANSAFNYCR